MVICIWFLVTDSTKQTLYNIYQSIFRPQDKKTSFATKPHFTREIYVADTRVCQESNVSMILKFLAFASKNIYCTRAIITRGLYILNPFLEGEKQFFKEVFSENSAFMYGLYSKAVCNQELVIMAHIR